ncbi:hypothetical protein [Aquabacter spiritensis]|uniref:Uncharacterized protein n=1 Tax=Aquabacter spiritensis TaxID=933073 RepID=A0A4R3LY24_9HYPH|nr:hypothetical protein [Aquabacter spiritensis]TCT03557.1 hypothetical protein EDC64_109107 [Aquabacter spiritensis]
MAMVALSFVLLSILGIAGSWGVAVYEGTLAEEAAGPVSLARRAQIIIWPFAARSGADPKNVHGRRAGKAQIVLIASVMVAVAAASAYTNLTYVRPGKAASAVVAAPSQS